MHGPSHTVILFQAVMLSGDESDAPEIISNIASKSHILDADNDLSRFKRDQKEKRREKEKVRAKQKLALQQNLNAETENRDTTEEIRSDGLYSSQEEDDTIGETRESEAETSEEEEDSTKSLEEASPRRLSNPAYLPEHVFASITSVIKGATVKAIESPQPNPKKRKRKTDPSDIQIG